MYLKDDSKLSYSEKHITYKIKNGDTLQNVARELNIEPRLLRAYHNIHCNLPDLIEADFPYQLDYLILAPEKAALTDEEREKKRAKVVFNDPPLCLSLNYARVDTTYGVLYTIENGDKIHTIKQKINVKWKAKSDNDFYFFEITRIGKIYINDTEADTMAEDIAEKASAALYPLIVVVDATGKWVDINNFEQVKKRWTTTKKEIQKYYKGAFIEKYFSIYDKTLENSDNLYLSLSKDWFLYALFNGIHVQYPPTLIIQKETGFPFITKDENISYQVDQTLDDYLDVDNFIIVAIKGNLNDERSKTDFDNALNIKVNEYTEERPMGTYRAKYFLNPNNYFPESVFVSCDLALDVTQKYTISISNLNDTKEQVIATRQKIFIDESKPQKKWWQF
ncbi:hypothetical protein [Flavobacterium sp. PL002]|uniref:hypothetical protein n=1 Tax=Flavobacterium sp. PL002 TaxID=1897058 RepID=UPI001787E525|nr:hypothetical protein [Flavobacterium sp. PL002]MBE0390784.1 hypothetical protein [Flavobacterium sp. PL002]